MVDNIIFDRIRKDIQNEDVVLFMMGSAAYPRCGFSAAVVEILGRLGVPFKDVDVSQDNILRQGIKDFTDWPTLPQLYVKGEFIGGCDITREMFETGELQDLLSGHNIPMNDAA